MPRTSRGDGLQLVQDWLSSGQSKAAFVAERGLRAQRLDYWIAQAESSDVPANAAAGFVEVAVDPVQPARDVGCELRIGACVVTWHSSPSPAYLAAVLERVAGY